MRRIFYLGSSQEDIDAFPDDVQDAVEYALQLAIEGEKAPSAKVLQGFGGASVLEVIEPFDTNTYRAVYTVRYKHAVYVLHAFMKRSKSGRAVPRRDQEVIERRLKRAQEHAAQWAKDAKP